MVVRVNCDQSKLHCSWAERRVRRRIITMLTTGRKSKPQSATVYPRVRMRRTRSSAGLRSLVRETHVHLEKLIYPLFVVEGKKIHQPINAMPGIYQQSVDQMLKEVEACAEA